jgi:hypothetical protein
MGGNVKFTAFCGMCGKETELEIDQEKVTGETTLSDIYKKLRWIVQQNGDNFDTYCSKKCAK